MQSRLDLRELNSFVDMTSAIEIDVLRISPINRDIWVRTRIPTASSQRSRTTVVRMRAALEWRLWLLMPCALTNGVQVVQLKL
jgi:hypothetical protein